MRPLIITLALLTAVAPARAEPPHADSLYYYRAAIIEVYDGDTVTADIDLGFSIWIRGERLRLARIDAPEVRGDDKEAGFAARDFLRELIIEKPIIVQTIRDRKGKYGRYIAELWLEGENVNDRMVAEGHAVYRSIDPSSSRMSLMSSLSAGLSRHLVANTPFESNVARIGNPTYPPGDLTCET